MSSLKNWLITILTRKDHLVCVPETWQTEYVKLAGDKVRNNQTMGVLITAYNELLKDYYKKCSIKELQAILEDGDKKAPTGATKAELVELAYTEYKMSIEK